MKYILLLFLIISIAVGISLKGKAVVIELVIPNDLLPYYKWLISFPGAKTLPVPPSQEKTPSYKSYEL